MQCDKCKEAIKEGEQRALHGRNLCEDCYMDALSPARTCDPWAVHSAKSFSKDEKFNSAFTETQSNILKILSDSGGAEPEVIVDQLKIKQSDFERDLAALRHMEKIRAELRDGKKFICLW